MVGCYSLTEPHFLPRSAATKQSTTQADAPMDCFASLAMTGTTRMTTQLLPHPLRRALLRERLWSLDVILRRYHRLHRRVLALLGHRLLERNRKALLHGVFGCPDRHWRVLADRLRPALRRRQRFTLRNHFIDKTELMALARGDVARGQDHAHGALETDLARQPLQSACERGEADAWLGQRECRILRG